MKEYAKNCPELPAGYEKVYEINLKVKKDLLVVTLLSFAIAVIVAVVGLLWHPFDSWLYYIINGENWERIVMIVIILAGMPIYLILHELTHGICFKLYSGRKPKYGLSLMYAYAKSDYYYNKRDYTVIGLAPVVIFFVVFLVLNLVLDVRWFYPVYILQLMNLSGAAGDLYVSTILIKQKRSVLIYDTGDGMTFWDIVPEKVTIAE